MRPLKPTTLNQALQEALEAEVWCKESLRVKVSTTLRPSPSSLRPRTKNIPATVTQIPQSPMRNQPYDSANHGLPLQLRMQMTCNFCKKMGHLEKQCYLKSKQQGFRNFTVKKRPPEVRNTQELEVIHGLLESYELTPGEHSIKIKLYRIFGGRNKI